MHNGGKAGTYWLKLPFQRREVTQLSSPFTRSRAKRSQIKASWLNQPTKAGPQPTTGLSALPRGGEVCDRFYNRSPDVKALALQKSSAKLSWVSGFLRM
jgi:hypothetical protein